MAALASEILASVATTFRITGTTRFEAKFGRLVTNGACHGSDLILLRGYFPMRHTTEVHYSISIALLIADASVDRNLRSQLYDARCSRRLIIPPRPSKFINPYRLCGY
jgi:hypothetical protein